MKLKRAFLIGLLAYFASLILGMVLTYAIGYNPTQSAQIPDSIFWINMIVTILVGLVFALYYFNDKKIESNAIEGLYFGLVLIGLGFILDMLFFWIGSFIGYQVDITTYYLNPLFWTALLLLVITTTLTGHIKSIIKS